jgi:hypothetical protein
MKSNNQNTNTLNEQAIQETLSAQKSPCLSLYQNTHRKHPDNLQDPIRFRDLIKDLEASLVEKYTPDEVQSFLKPFEDLLRDKEFWGHTLDGLAVLSCPKYFRAFRIPSSVPDLAVVADHFHIKPLRRHLQSDERYQVLGISLDHIRFFEGNRHSLGEVALTSEVPRTIEEALGLNVTDPHSTVASYGGVGPGRVAMHHAHGAKKDETDSDTERFFRAVDRSILEHYSKSSGLPLILVGLPEQNQVFRRISKNPSLMADGIKMNPDSISLDELQRMAWKVLEPDHDAKIAELTEEFEFARSKMLGSDDLKQIAKATASGRVKTLLIEANRQIGGRLDATTGQVELVDITHPDASDLLDDLGDLVEKMKGKVQVLPSARMPSKTGIAATYRF